jgi:Uma2 family endonuclease
MSSRMYDVGMGVTTTGLMTFEEFERLPDEAGKRELLDGEVIEMPPADWEHNEISTWIYHSLRESLAAAHSRGEAGELARVRYEAGYKLPDNRYLQPDVSITHTGQTHEKYWSGAPAIAIEVVSDSNTGLQMEKKIELYFRHGAHEVWRVYRDPLHFVIHFADSSRTVWQGSLTTPLLPGFELPISALQSLLEQKS